MDLIVTLRLGYDGPSNCASTIKINNAENGLRVLFATLWLVCLDGNKNVTCKSCGVNLISNSTY